MKDCISCGLSIESSWQYCGRCGVRLRATDKHRQCRLCGSMCKAYSKFCGCCGADMRDAIISMNTKDTKLLRCVKDIFTGFAVKHDLIELKEFIPPPPPPAVFHIYTKLAKSETPEEAEMLNKNINPSNCILSESEIKVLAARLHDADIASREQNKKQLLDRYSQKQTGKKLTKAEAEKSANRMSKNKASGPSDYELLTIPPRIYCAPKPRLTEKYLKNLASGNPSSTLPLYQIIADLSLKAGFTLSDFHRLVRASEVSKIDDTEVSKNRKASFIR